MFLWYFLQLAYNLILFYTHVFIIIYNIFKGEILAAFDETRTWFHAKCVADGTASAETITCARCDKVLLDTDTTKFINICGKLREVHARCGIKRSISEATNTSVESSD
jgi:phage FluMu protein Com